MISYCIVFLIFSHALLIQAQVSTGNIAPKGSSALPQEPINVGAKSVTANCGCIRVLTFDDITSTLNNQFSLITTNYGGLTWVNAYYMNTTWERVTYGFNGFSTGRNSGIFVGFNGGGQQMSISVPVGQYFQLNSLSLAAAWNNNLQLTIKGTRANVLLYQTVVTLQVTSKITLDTLKWSNVDKITFNSTGGTLYPGLSGMGTQFVVDDIDITI